MTLAYSFIHSKKTFIQHDLSQRESPIAIIRSTLQTKGITGLYSGCTALIVGNSVKAGVRFVSYDHFKQKLADSEVWRATSLCLHLIFLTCTVTVGEGQRAEKSLRFEVNLSQTLESNFTIFFLWLSWARSWHDGSDFRCDPF